uniref:Immunoglobulin V-set domain-containing protein n=1 Tax=Salmo trutta TaxID=8032 RepID=A0A674A296_SALTR
VVTCLLFSTFRSTVLFITVFGRHVSTGNYITIPCRYDQRYIQYVKYWCQGDYWNSCSALVRTDQPKLSGTVSISDDVTRRIFSVNMTDLQPEDSGYYWCAVETAGRDQNTYLHLSALNTMYLHGYTYRQSQYKYGMGLHCRYTLLHCGEQKHFILKGAYIRTS